MPQTSQMDIQVQTGVSASGNPVYANRRFNNVKPAASDADIFDIAADLGNLQTHPVQAILRVDTGTLVNQ